MNTHLWGNFLLENNYISVSDLFDAAYVNGEPSVDVTLPLLSIFHEKLTSNEVSTILSAASQNNSSFEEEADKIGYLSIAEQKALLGEDFPSYLLLAQTLINKEIISYHDFENIMVEYRSQTDILESDNEDIIEDNIVELSELSGGVLEEKIGTEFFTLYMKLFYSNITDYIEDDFNPLPPMEIPDYPSDILISQALHLDSDYYVALGMEQDTALEFANIFIGHISDEQYDEYNAYVCAALEDFLNLVNGMFAVNLSNMIGKEITLSPPEDHSHDIYFPAENSYLIPLLFSFGSVNLIISC